MFNILGTSPLMKKYEEINCMYKKLGEIEILVIGAVVKQGIQAVKQKDVEYRIEAVNFIAGILQIVFNYNRNDCVTALNTAACFLNEYNNTYDEYTREFITCLKLIY